MKGYLTGFGYYGLGSDGRYHLYSTEEEYYEIMREEE